MSTCVVRQSSVIPSLDASSELTASIEGVAELTAVISGLELKGTRTCVACTSNTGGRSANAFLS